MLQNTKTVPTHGKYFLTTHAT